MDRPHHPHNHLRERPLPLLLEAEAVDGVGDGGLFPRVVVGEEVPAGLFLVFFGGYDMYVSVCVS